MAAAPPQQTEAQRSRGLARSTFIVIFAFAAAKAVSLAQTFIIARAFGISAEYDAFVGANRIPEQIYNLIAGGAIAFAFIPVFTGLLARKSTEEAWRTASYVINTIFLFTFIASVIAFIGGPWLVANWVAPGFTPDQQYQTVALMRILLLSTLIFSISGVSMGILQSHNRFLLPALAPILYDIGILIGIVLLIPAMGIYGVAWGAVLGTAMHLGIQLPGLWAVRMRWKAALGWNDPNLRQIIKLMIPRAFDLGLNSFLLIVTGSLLSRLGTGATSAYDWGWRIMQIPETLIGTAMGIVIFPTLSALSAVGDTDGKRGAMAGAIRFILIGTIPAAIALIVIGRAGVSLLERGAFDSNSTTMVYNTLQYFAFGIIVHSLLEIIARSFYADKDTITPLMVAFGGMAVNLFFAFTLSGIFEVERIGFGNTLAQTMSMPGLRPYNGNPGGLALANTMGVAFEVSVLAFILRRRWNGLEAQSLLVTTGKALAASLVMALVILLVDAALDMLGLKRPGSIGTIITLSIETGIGLIVFVLMARLLRLDEVGQVLAMVPVGLRRARRLLPFGASGT